MTKLTAKNIFSVIWLMLMTITVLVFAIGSVAMITWLAHGRGLDKFDLFFMWMMATAPCLIGAKHTLLYLKRECT